MRFAILSATASLLSLAAAQNANAFKTPREGYSLTAGKPTTLNWTPTTPGTVSLYLRSGASSALDKGELIQAGIPNSGTFTYTPPASTVRNSDYTIEIVSDSDPSQFNYTPQFVIESSNTVESVTPVASSASATLAASSSSAAASISSASSSVVVASSSSLASVVSSIVSSLSSASSASLVSSVSSVSRASSATAVSTVSRASVTSGLSASASSVSATRASGSAATQTAASTAATSTSTSAPNVGGKAYGVELSSTAAIVLLCFFAVR